jgi:endonuclease G
MPPLPHADEPHTVPSGFWQVVAVTNAPGAVTAVAFLFDQETPRTDAALDHLVTIDEVERRSGLDLFRLLPDAAEAALEAALDAPLARQLLFPTDSP